MIFIFIHENVFLKFSTLINYIFSTQIQASYGKRMSMQQEKKPYVKGSN
jgi:hypothetical protein